MAEGARLESVCGGNLTVGSNPTLSATSPSRDFLQGGAMHSARIRLMTTGAADGAARRRA